MAARKRLAAALLAAVVLSGCTYSSNEPGLFGTKSPSQTPSPTRSRLTMPAATNPSLPVAGEALWTTGDGLHVAVRFAIHAVRRIPGATVLDWSVTPLAAPGRQLGDDISHQVDLGLSTVAGGDVTLSLVDNDRGEVYPPLQHVSRRLFNHCLCTPLWVVQQHLRIGETRLLQVTFPELPSQTEFIDVVLPNVAPFSHVPVSPVDTIPEAVAAADLVRPRGPRLSGAKPVSVSADGRRATQTIEVDRVVAARDSTSLEWTIWSLTDQSGLWLQAPRQPVSSERPELAYVVNSSPTDGPQLRAGGSTLTARWVKTHRFGRTAYSCFCSDLGLWARALTRSGGSLSVMTSFPPLPPGTSRIDVVLPGAGVVRGVPVVTAPDAAAGTRPPVPHSTGTWTYNTDDPPAGWATQDWPTDVPDSDQLADYQAQVDRLVDRPRA